MAKDLRRVHTAPLHAVHALRAVILLALAGVIAWTALSWGRRGKPQPVITMTAPPATPAATGPVTDQSDRFQANGTREGRPAFDLLAQTVTGLQGERKLLHTVNLTVHQQQGGEVQVEGREGEFDAQARRAHLSGDVDIHTPDGLSLATGNLYYDSQKAIISTDDPMRFTLGQVTGTGRGMTYLVNDRRLRIASRVRLTVVLEDGGPPVEITASSLAASLADNVADFTGPVRMTRGDQTLTGGVLHLELDQARTHLRSLRSAGGVTVAAGPDAGGQSGSLQADSLVAEVGLGNLVESAEAAGGCRVVSGPYTATSRTAVFKRDADRLELRGDPVVLTDRERIAAQEIDLKPIAQVLQARLEVHTMSLASGRAAPGFDGSSSLSFQADRLDADQKAQRALYSGGARAWQEGSSLQADEIEVDQAARSLRAKGSVVSRYTTRPAGRAAGGADVAPAAGPASAADARPLVTVITARTLVFDDASGTAHYQDDTRLTRPDATLAADAMDATFKAEGGRRDLDRVIATGSVHARHEGATATAQSAEFQSGGKVLVLRDDQGLAEVIEPGTGRSMRGRELTYDMVADRVLTESEPGGRVWIALRPDQDPKKKGAGEPTSRH